MANDQVMPPFDSLTWYSVLESIETTTIAVDHIAKAHNVAPYTIDQWRDSSDSRGREYARSMRTRIESIAWGTLATASDRSRDIITDAEGNFVAVNSAAVQRSKLMVDTAKWIASKLLPKVYGERVDVEATVVHKLDRSAIVGKLLGPGTGLMIDGSTGKVLPADSTATGDPRMIRE